MADQPNQAPQIEEYDSHGEHIKRISQKVSGVLCEAFICDPDGSNSLYLCEWSGRLTLEEMQKTLSETIAFLTFVRNEVDAKLTAGHPAPAEEIPFA